MLLCTLYCYIRASKSTIYTLIKVIDASLIVIMCVARYFWKQYMFACWVSLIVGVAGAGVAGLEVFYLVVMGFY